MSRGPAWLLRWGTAWCSSTAPRGVCARVTVRAGWCSAPGLGTGMFSCGVAWPGVRRGQALTGQSHPQGEKVVVEGGRKRQRCGKLGLVGLVGLPSCRSEAAGSWAGPWAGLLGAVLHAAGQALRRGLCVSQTWEMLPAVHSKCCICAVCLNCNGSSPAMSEAHFFPPWCCLPLPIPCQMPPQPGQSPPAAGAQGAAPAVLLPAASGSGLPRYLFLFFSLSE